MFKLFDSSYNVMKKNDMRIFDYIWNTLLQASIHSEWKDREMEIITGWGTKRGRRGCDVAQNNHPMITRSWGTSSTQGRGITWPVFLVSLLSFNLSLFWASSHPLHPLFVAPCFLSVNSDFIQLTSVKFVVEILWNDIFSFWISLK